MNVSLALLAFAILIALRDILSEAWLIESPITFAFSIATTISLFSLATVLFKGNATRFANKFKTPGVWVRAIPLGIFSVLIYALSYYLVKKVGAGLFNVVDYGLTPIITILLGKLFFGEHIKKEFKLSIFMYLLGLVLLNFYRSTEGLTYLLLILVIPFGVSFSDALTKWLLSKERGNFTQEELLLVRFLPGAVCLGFFGSFLGPTMEVKEWVPLVSVSIFFGWLPLWLLCSVLPKAKLSQLALIELLIPGLAFFGTLNLHLEENGKLIPILGAILILSIHPVCHWVHQRKSIQKTNQTQVAI